MVERMGQFRDFLSDIMLVVGLAIFLLSILQPFLILHDVRQWNFGYFDMFARTLFRQVDLFTSKATYDPVGPVVPWALSHSWSQHLNWYWLNSYNWLEVGADPSIGYFLIVTFAVQILTLLMGFFALSLKPRMRIVPLVLCLFTTFLLTWVSYLITDESPFRGYSYSWNLGNGYWMTLASIPCLLSSIMLTRGRQSKMMFRG